MEIIIIIALIAAGLLLFMVEVFLIPGLSLAGIASAGCLLYVNYYAFTRLGSMGGGVVLLLSLSCYIALLIWFFRTKSIDRLALKKNIDSTVSTPARKEVKPGDTGVAITRLALIGNADINGQIVEVKSADGFLDERTPIIVERLMEGVIMVRRR